MPIASKNSAISLESGAEPETKKLEPPAEERADLREDEPVGERALRREQPGPGLRRARTLAREARGPTPRAQRKIAAFTAPALARPRDDLGVDLLEDAGDRADEGRPHRREVLDDLLDAPVHRGREPDPQLGRADHLPERVGEREPEELEHVGVVEDAASPATARDCDTQRRVRQLDALRLAGRAGRVDERRERVRADAGRGLLERAGARRRPTPGPRASSSASGRTHPSALASPSKTTTWRSAGSSARRDASFATCSSLSANATTAPESARMNAHSSARGRRVDGARRGAGAEDPVVRQDPLDAGGREDGADLLARDAERPQPATRSPARAPRSPPR